MNTYETPREALELALDVFRTVQKVYEYSPLVDLTMDKIIAALAAPDPVAALKSRIDSRLDSYLAEMKPGYDDSIVGFNEAWDLVRKIFDEAAS